MEFSNTNECLCSLQHISYQTQTIFGPKRFPHALQNVVQYPDIINDSGNDMQLNLKCLPNRKPNSEPFSSFSSSILPLLFMLLSLTRIQFINSVLEIPPKHLNRCPAKSSEIYIHCREQTTTKMRYELMTDSMN